MSTFGVRGRVECVCVTECFNKVTVYFVLKFKLQREQEVAVESTCMYVKESRGAKPNSEMVSLISSKKIYF